MSSFFFFNDTATTEIYTLSLHDALPIYYRFGDLPSGTYKITFELSGFKTVAINAFELGIGFVARTDRSEEHTSELQSLAYLVCRLLLEKKKQSSVDALSIALRRSPKGDG